MNGSKWQSPTIGVAFALFIVWMERQGRWSLFAKAIGGQYAVAGSRNSGQGSQQGINGPGGGVGGQSPTFNQNTGAANPGTGVASGGGLGPGGSGYGTGNAPGYSSDPNNPGRLYQA